MRCFLKDVTEGLFLIWNGKELIYLLYFLKGKIEVHTTASDSWLKISDCGLDDTGLYTAMVTNGHINQTFAARLTVVSTGMYRANIVSLLPMQYYARLSN